MLGLNPGMMTGSGTNTYLVGGRDPILIDTGAGVADYAPLFGEYLDHRGWARPSRIIRTHHIATIWAASRISASAFPAFPCPG